MGGMGLNRRAGGFGKTGFIKKLSLKTDKIAKIFNVQVDELYELIPDFGKKAAGDGKYIDSYAKRGPKNEEADKDSEANKNKKGKNGKIGNRAETEARWSKKVYRYVDKDGKNKVKTELHYGYKVHIICDVETELPIAYVVTAANADEREEMKTLLETTVFPNEVRTRIMEYILLDRGYDSIDMIKTIKGKGIVPVIDICNKWKDGEATKQYKDTNIVYNYRGDVFYVNEKCEQVKMKFEGYDRQKKCLRYSYNKKTYKIYISYDERIFLPIARDSEKFKKIYKGRTSVERLNGRLDRDYMFEEHCIRGLKKMTVMVGLAMIIMNGMAIGKLKNGKEKIRSLKNAA
jgi:hypothetical protein